MTSFKAPQLIFGCGGLGAEFVGKDATTELLQVLKEAGICRVDTAGLYPPTDIGASQRLLGEAGAAKMGFTIDTKVLISMKGFSGTLRPDAIEKSLQTSIQALQFGEGQRINVYYPHAPDKDTPLEDQAHGFNAQYQNGHFNKLGLCNYPADMLSEFIKICEKEGYVKPSVYEGIYSIVDRRHEGKVFETVRNHGMQFVVHSPNASGFLRGSLTSGQVEGTRFAKGNIMSMDARRYDLETYHEAIRSLDKILEPHGILKPEASLRWLAYHSQLTPDDAIVFGSSKLDQIRQNVASVGKGPLPEEVVAALDGVWDTLKETCPKMPQGI